MLAPSCHWYKETVLEQHSPRFSHWKMLFHPPGMEEVDGGALWFLQWVLCPRHPLVPEKDVIWD